MQSRNPIWELVFPSYIRNLLEAVEAEGLEIGPIIERHKLLQQLTHIPDAAQAQQIYMDVAGGILATTGIEALGLKSGSRFDLSDHGLLGYAVNCCKNLRKALEVFCNFSPIVGGYQAKLHTDPGSSEASLQFSNTLSGLREDLLRFHVEETFAVWYGIARKWSGPHQWFNEVHFEFSPPPYARLYEEFFQCPVRFNETGNRFIFSRDFLSLPFINYNEHLFRMTVTQCRQLLDDMPPTGDVADQVRTLLTRYPGRLPNFEEVCRHFNVSTATLRRRLAKEGTNYQQLLKTFRVQMAGRYLRETHLSVNEIAYLTGYSDAANFTRAFRSVEGRSPNQYRSEIARTEPGITA